MGEGKLPTRLYFYTQLLLKHFGHFELLPSLHQVLTDKGAAKIDGTITGKTGSAALFDGLKN